MLRKWILLVAVLTAVALLPSESAQARRWSPGNPGIHGNIHGITYRSLRWEQQHGNQRQTVYRSRARFFWRR